MTYAELPRGGRVSVRSIMRPEPDIKMIAKVIRDIAIRDVDTRMQRQRKLSRAAIRATYPQPADAT